MRRKHFKIRLGLALAFAVAAFAASAQARPMIEGGSAQASFSTPQGLKADGLRLQGIAHVYQSIGQSATTGSALVGRSPDATASAQPSFSTPQGLKAEGLRLQGIAQVYQSIGRSATTGSSQSSGFDWGDYTVGIGTGMGLILILAGGLAMGRQRRHRVQTA